MAISKSCPRHLVQFREKKHFESFFFLFLFKKMQLFIKMHHFFCIGLSTHVIHPSYPPGLSTRVIHLGYPPRLSTPSYPPGLFVQVIRLGYLSGLSSWVIYPGYPPGSSAQVISSVTHPVIWCFPIWLTTSLSYPMAIFSANEIRTFYIWVRSNINFTTTCNWRENIKFMENINIVWSYIPTNRYGIT